MELDIEKLKEEAAQFTQPTIRPSNGWSTSTPEKRVTLSAEDLDAMAGVLESKMIEEPKIEPTAPLTDTQHVAPLSKGPINYFTVKAASKSLPEGMATGGGYKLDVGKPRWELSPFDAFEALVKVQTWAVSKDARGDKAYPERNWEKGMKWSRVFGAMMRHAWKWWMSKMAGGEANDSDSGMSHAWHFFTCASYLVAYELRGMTDFDDRPGEIAQKP